MRYLVTGGAGFIGSNFVNRLLELDSSVSFVVFDSLTYAADLDNLMLDSQRIHFVEADIRDAEAVSKAVQGVDAVVNFAAESHNDNSILAPHLFFETNVIGTLNLVHACAKGKVRFHHVSTDEVFGDLDFDSEQEFRPDTSYNPSSPYAASKASSDHIVRSWIRTFDLSATISNCSNNYGKNQHWEKLIPATIRSLLQGQKPKVYGSGRNVRDWIHVEDHVDGIHKSITQGKPGETYLFGARDRLTNLTVVRAILTHFNLPPDHIEFVADRPGHDRRYSVDPSLSEQELGWSPSHISLIAEIPMLVDHYSEKFRRAANDA